jgi:hypothetical protein
MIAEMFGATIYWAASTQGRKYSTGIDSRHVFTIAGACPLETPYGTDGGAGGAAGCGAYAGCG